MSKDRELKSCPFCGCDVLAIRPNVHSGLLRVQCEGCWATSVTSNNRATVIAAWNRRYVPPPHPSSCTCPNAWDRTCPVHGQHAAADRRPAPADGVRAQEIVDHLLSMCDPSNWDAEGFKGAEFTIRQELYERLHEVASDYQDRIRSLSKDGEGRK